MNPLAYIVIGMGANGISRLTAKVVWFYLKPRLKRENTSSEGYGWQ